MRKARRSVCSINRIAASSSITGDAGNRLERHVTGLLYFGLYEEMAEYDT